MICSSCTGRMSPAVQRDVLVCEICGRERSGLWLQHLRGSRLGRFWLWIWR